MCTHFTPIRNAAWVQDQFGLAVPGEYPDESYPGYLAPIVVQSHRSGRMACGLARFGLIPHWAKDNTISRHTYNARAETVAEKPSYRTAWKNRQFALLPVEHFFEPSYASGKAVPWKISLATGEPFALACLWERWKDPQTAAEVVSFSMLTINADTHPVMQQFHKPGDEKRTPVVIMPSLHHAWLNADCRQATALLNWVHMPQLQAVAA
jgi:putative SOS response-associated peptidase YedK